MKFTVGTDSFYVSDGSGLVLGSALIGPGGKIPTKLDTLLKRLVGELGHREVAAALPGLAGHVLLVGGPLICMPGNLAQLYAAIRQAKLDSEEMREAIAKAYGSWSGAKGYEKTRRNRRRR